MTYSPYGSIDTFDEEERQLAKQSVQERTMLQADLEISSKKQEQALQEAEKEALAQQGTSQPNSPEQPSQEQPEQSQEEKQPNPNQPPEGEEDRFSYNVEVGEHELKSGEALRAVGEAVTAPIVGTIDGFTDVYNYFLPGPDIPEIPKFKDSNLQVIREVSSFIGPTLTGIGAWTKGLKLLSVAPKLPGAAKAILANPLFRWLSGFTADMGAGAIVDQSSRHSVEDNMNRQLRDAFQTPESERLFGIFPASLATNDTDSPELKRAKNRNEGFGLGLLTGIGEGVIRVASAAAGTRQATKWITKDSAAAKYFEKIQNDKFSKTKFSEDPLEDSILRSEARAQANLDELGEFYVAKYNEAEINNGGRFLTVDEIPFEKPVKGIHDQFDMVENGVRTADPDGVPGAMVDAVRVQKNIQTRHGRLGSIVTEAALRWGLEVDSLSKAQLVNAVKDHIIDSGKFDYLLNDRLITAKEIDEAGTFLAEVMEEMKPGEMHLLLEDYRKLNDDLNTQVVNKVGYDAVFKSIKKYQDMFLDLDEKKARALLSTSLAGQASDMAGELRNLEGTAAIEAARDQIFGRMEYLMVQKALASYDAGSTLNSLNVWKRIKRLADGKGATDYVAEQVQAREKFLGTLITEAKSFTKQLMDIADENPKFLKPLFDAYHMTDGKISSMYALNNYVYENLGALQQAVMRGEDTMPNLIVQGFWSNYYNSILSATATPIRAAVGNLGGLIARPINTMAGSLMSGDLRMAHRAFAQYAGFTEAFQNAWGHMGFYWHKTTENPMSTMEYGRGDLVIQRNEENIGVLREFAEASKADGEYGPEYLLNFYEDMHSVATNPWFRYSANIMGAADAFTRAFIATAEARGRAYDQLLVPGKKILPKDMKKTSAEIYNSMVDKKGWVTDQASEYFSREIALNLDSDMAKGLSKVISDNPWLKPFILFPRTSVNMLGMFAKYSPLAGVTKDFWDLVGYGNMNEVPLEHIQAVLTRKGIKFDENAINTFRQMRAEAKGRIAVGTLSVAGITGMVMSDRLRGTGHHDKERQRVRTDLGWKKKTYLGNDGKWHSYDWLGPIGDWIALVADIRDNFDLISSAKQEHLAEKMTYILGAAIFDRSVMAMVEPMNDVLSGNGAAANRWGSNFVNSVLPFGGLRAQFSRFMSEGLREVDNEFTELLRNRNNYLDFVDPDGALAPKYDWVDAGKVGYVENFFQRAVNVFLGHQMSDRLSEEKGFLVEIEYDSRPVFMKDDEGNELDSATRSALYYKIGEMGVFKKKLKVIMQDAETVRFIDKLRYFRREGIGSDPRQGGVAAEEYYKIYDRIDAALGLAKKLAISNLSTEMRQAITKQESITRMNKAMQERGTWDPITNMYK